MQQYDYSKLKGKIRETFEKQSEFATALGISDASLSNKLNNKNFFDQNEISKAINLLNINSGEEAWNIFFTQLVDFKSTK